MAFPTTGLIDDFNRSDEGPPLSSDWTSVQTGLVVDSNEAAADGSGGNIDLYDASTFGPDCEVFAEITTSPSGSGDYMMLLARMTTLSIGTTDGYLIAWNHESGTDEAFMHRVDNGSVTQMGATVSQDYSAGDLFGMEIIGSTIKLFQNTGGGWSEIASRTEGTYSSAGYIGIGIENTVGRFDDFSGGTVVVGGSAIPAIMHHRRQQGMS